MAAEERARSRGRVEAIWIKPRRRAPMRRVQRAVLVPGRGIVGNADQGGQRQVTLMEAEVWRSVMARLGASLDPAARRANFLVAGIDLAHSQGRVLALGTCRIRIRGENRPCERMDEALPGLRDALAAPWAGGAFGDVLDDGEVAVGDPVHWLP